MNGYHGMDDGAGARRIARVVVTADYMEMTGVCS